MNKGNCLYCLADSISLYLKSVYKLLSRIKCGSNYRVFLGSPM